MKKQILTKMIKRECEISFINIDKDGEIEAIMFNDGSWATVEWRTEFSQCGMTQCYRDIVVHVPPIKK